MFDCHAHPGLPSSSALVCTASTFEVDVLSLFPYSSLGSLPGRESSLVALEEWAEHSSFLGEVGLDRRYPDKEEQIQFFSSALSIAKSHGCLVTIHQVGWMDALLREIKAVGIKGFLIHGFTGSIESAREIERMGGIVSLSPSFSRTKGFSSFIKSGLPFLTESDMETGEEEEKALREWNTFLSGILDRDIEDEVQKRADEIIVSRSIRQI